VPTDVVNNVWETASLISSGLLPFDKRPVKPANSIGLIAERLLIVFLESFDEVTIGFADRAIERCCARSEIGARATERILILLRTGRAACRSLPSEW
jgi:hypothetical protein